MYGSIVIALAGLVDLRRDDPLLKLTRRPAKSVFAALLIHASKGVGRELALMASTMPAPAFGPMR